jgi:hypothetical protein
LLEVSDAGISEHDHIREVKGFACSPFVGEDGSEEQEFDAGLPRFPQ